jgi:flagellar L-ring protein precursor FlgH
MRGGAMEKLFLAILTSLMILTACPLVMADSLYPVEGSSSIYTEKRARRVGDVITVMIQETNQATNAASSQDQKSGSLVVGAGTGFLGSTNFLNNNINNNIGLGAGTAHQGQGTSSRSSTVTGQMTAKIVSVLPSGNYLIEGTRYVEVNDEKQTIDVTGEIRPDDIASDNSVLSTRVANARIKFTGTGPASETAKPGLLTRVLGWLGLF